MPAANLSGCHCGCRWWGRDLPSSPSAAEPHVPESRMVQSEVSSGGMRSGADTCPGLDPGRRCRPSSPSPIPFGVTSWRLGGSSRSSVGATPTPCLSGLRKDRLCSDLRPHPLPRCHGNCPEGPQLGRVAFGTQLAPRPWRSCPAGPAHRQHRGQRPDPPARWSDLPKPSPPNPDSRFLAHGAPPPRRPPPPTPSLPADPLFVSRPPLFLGHPAARCGPFGAPCCGRTWPGAEAGWPQFRPDRRLPLGHPRPPCDARGKRAPLCPAAWSPARQLGRPLGGRIVRRICPRREGPPGAGLAFLPREGRRAGRASGPFP